MILALMIDQVYVWLQLTSVNCGRLITAVCQFADELMVLLSR
jgi:hypothetical protein